MVGKQYVAVVHGHLAHETGEIDLALREDADNRPRQIVDPLRGRRALTRYQVLERLGTGADATTRVALKPVTGRAHQLRVHLLAIGHPIVGDPLYTPPALAATSAAAHPRPHAPARRPHRLDPPAHPGGAAVRQPGAVLKASPPGPRAPGPQETD